MVVVCGRRLNDVSTMRDLGPEYDDAEFPQGYLADRLKRRSPLKSILVDQKTVSGIGNAYAHEIAFEAGIRPDRVGITLTPDEVARLYAAIGTVFQYAIGVRLKSPLNVMGDEGWDLARIHRRKGQPCPRCSAEIGTLKMGGNLLYFCPECQQ